MKIVVCIKPVKSELVYPSESRVEEYLINPYDLYALQESVKIKQFMDCKIICLCMGPMGAVGMMQKALAMGADQAIILNDNLFRGSDTVATSYILAKAIKKIGNVSLVTCGRRTIDGETGQVVYGIGERLRYYCLPEVAEILEASGDALKVMQVTESENLVGQLNLPAIVAFHDFILSQPQISLLALKKARKSEITVWNAADLEVEEEKCGLEGSKTRVMQIEKEICKKKKAYIDGKTEEKAAFIFNIIKGKHS